MLILLTLTTFIGMCILGSREAPTTFCKQRAIHARQPTSRKQLVNYAIGRRKSQRFERARVNA